MCVYLCIYICVCIYIREYICIWVRYIYIHKYVHIDIFIYTYINVYTHTYIYIYISVYVCIYIYVKKKLRETTHRSHSWCALNIGVDRKCKKTDCRRLQRTATNCTPLQHTQYVPQTTLKKECTRMLTAKHCNRLYRTTTHPICATNIMMERKYIPSAFMFYNWPAVFMFWIKDWCDEK